MPPPGDIVTVLLTLKRTDKDEGYTMYAMQDEICYDPAFFELVQGSAMSAAAIETTDISLRGGLRAFYMNFVSFGGGEDWNASTMIGTFQLKVIGTSGSSVIRNTENLVSTADGMDSYATEARDVTVVVTDDCTVKFESNGGSFVPEQVVKRGQYVTRPEDPTREGFVLEGWYTDFDMTRPWDFDRDTVTASMTLYARWTDGTAIAPVDENGGGQVPVWVWIALGALLLLLVLFLLLRRRTVRFETFGGTAIDSRKVRRGEKLTPAHAACEGGCGLRRLVRGSGLHQALELRQRHGGKEHERCTPSGSNRRNRMRVQMRKRITALLLAFVMTASLLPVTAQAGLTGGGGAGGSYHHGGGVCRHGAGRELPSGSGHHGGRALRQDIHRQLRRRPTISSP